MSLVASAEPTHVPPRVRLDMDTSAAGLAFSELLVYRDGKQLRDRPPIGGEESVLYDYEAPFGVPVTYQLVGVEAGSAVLYNEPWTNLDAWTVEAGAPVVSGGQLSGDGTKITRAQSLPESGSLAALSGSFTPSGSVGKVTLNLGGPKGITITRSRSSIDGLVLTAITIGGQTAAGFGGDIVWSPQSSIVRRSDGTSTQLPAPIFDSSTWTITIADGGALAGFTVLEAASIAPITATSTTTLDVAEAWLIHPGQPTLSTSIDPGAHRWRNDGLNVDTTSAEESSHAARRNEFEVIGRKRSIVVTSGPRADGEWTLVLFAPRTEDRDAALALVDDQTPLLLRSPQGWAWDLPDGWYSVGDVTVARVAPSLARPARRISLPLTPVDAPVVRVAALRTYADLLLENGTYADLLERYETYLDVLTGDRA